MVMLGHLSGARVLLLQGPNGPFFARLAKALEAEGAVVTKVNFNGGDYVFFPDATHTFRDLPALWPAYCERLLTETSYDWVLVYGDCRPIHRVAIEIAKRRGVRVGVFEEGYLRPNFVTFEQDGVNARSSLPRNASFFHALPGGAVPGAPAVESAFLYQCLFSAAYHTAGTALWPWFRDYEHHRPFGIHEAVPWVRGALRKYRYRIAERGLEAEVTANRNGYFLVPLQIHNDAQVTVHSDYASVTDFIAEVMRSFAAHAPADTRLVLKHHPLDRGYNDYARVIARAADQFGIRGRVTYLHDQHLPSLIEGARGVVVINSTAGLQALDHRAPVKVCGRAVYDVPGLTFRGPLDKFWRAAATFEPDLELLAAFKRYLVLNAQLGGSFYGRLPSGALLEEFADQRREDTAAGSPSRDIDHPSHLSFAAQ